MYHKWLDHWDERRARRGEEWKVKTDFRLDAHLAFPGAENVTTLAEFIALANKATADPHFFEAPKTDYQRFERRDEWVKFPSDIITDLEENNTVWAKITDSGNTDRALVIFHHWNATARNHQIAKFFSRRGITVVEIAMPYHFERSRPGSHYADFMMSSNLGRTIQSVRQGVLDGRKLIRWLQLEGYRDISVFGMSLGSWVAGLVAAHDTAVSRASLFLAAGSLADLVWTGRATKSIKESLKPSITLFNLRQAWAPLNLANHVRGFARPDLKLHIVLAKRDTVVLPALSDSFIKALEAGRVIPSVFKLNCGHYSLGRPPYILAAGLSLKQQLQSD